MGSTLSRGSMRMGVDYWPVGWGVKFWEERKDVHEEGRSFLNND